MLICEHKKKPSSRQACFHSPNIFICAICLFALYSLFSLADIPLHFYQKLYTWAKFIAVKKAKAEYHIFSVSWHVKICFYPAF